MSFLNEPSRHALVVTGSDTVPLTAVATSGLELYNLTANATLKITTASGEIVSISFGSGTAMQVVLKIQVAQVWSTGTANIGTIVAKWN